jgi:hypothetical protein
LPAKKLVKAAEIYQDLCEDKNTFNPHAEAHEA